METLENVQKRATKILPKLSHFKYSDRLSEALLLAPKCDDVTSKEGKFMKDAFFQFISETQVKL